jgi:hypothetical protein
MGKKNKNLINGKHWAYTVVAEGPSSFIVVICGENEQGYRPLPDDCDDAVTHKSEKEADDHARRLNERLGVSESEVHRIVGSTMPKTKRRGAA